MKLREHKEVSELKTNLKNSHFILGRDKTVNAPTNQVYGVGASTAVSK